MEVVPGYFSVGSMHLATDHHVYDTTIVKADSEEDAFNKFNEWVDKNPLGYYTPEKCQTIEHVHPIKALIFN